MRPTFRLCKAKSLFECTMPDLPTSVLWNEVNIVAPDKGLLFSSKKYWYLSDFSMKTFFGHSLEVPHRGASNEYPQCVYMQGPVVQSVVSSTSSLRVISLTVLADSIYNILIFFAEKMWVAFALQKLLTFFQQKISAYLRITQCKF